MATPRPIDQNKANPVFYRTKDASCIDEVRRSQVLVTSDMMATSTNADVARKQEIVLNLPQQNRDDDDIDSELTSLVTSPKRKDELGDLNENDDPQEIQEIDPNVEVESLIVIANDENDVKAPKQSTTGSTCATDPDIDRTTVPDANSEIEAVLRQQRINSAGKMSVTYAPTSAVDMEIARRNGEAMSSTMAPSEVAPANMDARSVTSEAGAVRRKTCTPASFYTEISAEVKEAEGRFVPISFTFAITSASFSL